MLSKIHAKYWYRKNRFRGGTGSRRLANLGVRRGLRGKVNLPPGGSEIRKKERKEEREKKGKAEGRKRG